MTQQYNHTPGEMSPSGNRFISDEQHVREQQDMMGHHALIQLDQAVFRMYEAELARAEASRVETAVGQPALEETIRAEAARLMSAANDMAQAALGSYSPVAEAEHWAQQAAAGNPLIPSQEQAGV